MKIRADSTEYVSATLVADHDLAGKTIEVAVPVTNQAPATWYPADIVSVQQTSTSPPRWTATYRVLIGPAGGAVALTAGTYDWTVRLTDTPEVPVRKAGSVTVSDT